MKPFNPTLDFSGAPTVARFWQDDDVFVRTIIGPLGSGKSTGCTGKLMHLATQQDVDPRFGVRRSRHAIIRNTGPQLKTTTMKTWVERWPEEACGQVRYSAPMAQHVKVPPKPGMPGLDAEFLFIALDEPKDVAKLQSLDITSAWVNEGSETPPAIIKMLRGRVGRFPPRDDATGVMARNACVVIDTNAPDEQHYLAQFDSGKERPTNWRFYHQPPAVLECEPKGDRLVSKEPGFPGSFSMAQGFEAAGRWWIVNPMAENLHHLPPNYYHNQISGSDLPWIQRFLQGKYVYVREGKAVVPNFREDTHVRDDLPILKDADVLIGTDIGGGTLSPAMLFAQRTARGGWLIHDELVADDMGVDNFTRQALLKMAERFPGHSLDRVSGWGDPAASGRDEIYEVAVFDHMRTKGIKLQPAPSQDIHMRVGAWVSALDRMIDGVPYVLIARRCVQLRKALAGGWHYKRMPILNEERYHEAPNKNHPDSDIGDAGGYLLLGGGEGRHIRRGDNGQSFSKPAVMKVDFDIFGSD